ncbi:hypothetical protein ACTL6P_01695 [Endozoicomonas acroporae]|uniref:hypothetical protein n=1 Tax=Endozoicomonas acroporae TaxID=1701104 RepID=UPI003F894581
MTCTIAEVCSLPVNSLLSLTVGRFLDRELITPGSLEAASAGMAGSVSIGSGLAGSEVEEHTILLLLSVTRLRFMDGMGPDSDCS